MVCRSSLLTRLNLAFARVLHFSGTQHLLLYVQVPELATTRPWIWVAMIGLGPLLSSTFFNLFMTLSLRFARQVESLVLQLLFEHSLRLRVTELPAEAVLADGKEKKNLVGKVNSLMVSNPAFLQSAGQTQADLSSTLSQSNDVAQAGQIRMVLYYYTELVFGTREFHLPVPSFLIPSMSFLTGLSLVSNLGVSTMELTPMDRIRRNGILT